MAALGLWVALVGYTVLYAGIANWSAASTGGQGLSIPQAFTGQNTPTCTSSSKSGGGGALPAAAPGLGSWG